MKSFPVTSTSTILTIASLFSTASSFAPNSSNSINVHVSTNTRIRNIPPRTSSTIHMMPIGIDIPLEMSSMASASNFISTVSADIDSIPQNEFATVFGGGIAVMIGSVISTLMVGFLLESNNSYASVVADSYAQGGDEAFWESLSPEDQIKTKAMLEKLRKSKEGKNGNGNANGNSHGSVEVKSEGEDIVSMVESQGMKASKEDGKKDEVSMFSDYND